jgi:nucleoside-diphosphate-sugar epimerase
MDIFVTGASGYIGGVVAEKLQAAGHRVAGLARSDAAEGCVHARGMTPIRADLFDAARLAQAATRADGVIHLAASFGPDWQAGDRAAVQALLSALEGSSKPFVYTSITTVYGDTGATVADEDAPLHALPFHQWRPQVEQEVLAAAARGVRSIVLRPAPVYGRDGGSSVLLLVQNARQAGVARYIDAGETRWSTVHVDDLADLYVLALERAAGGTLLNASGGVSVAMRELAAAVSCAVGLGGACEPWTLDAARAAFGPRADLFAMNQQISGARAILRLGWNPQAPSLLHDVAFGSYPQALSA